MIAKALFARRAFAMLACASFVSACSAPTGTGEADNAGTDAQSEEQAMMEESAEQAAPVDSAIPAHFRALGTEPFWAVTNGSAGLRYMTPENSEGVAVTVTGEDEQENSRNVTGTLEDNIFTIEIAVATCSDGMSDRIYPFTATLKLGEEERRGCARPLDS